MTPELPKRKCAMCRCIRLESEFGIRKYDIPYKTCQVCREKVKKSQEKKCDHGKLRSQCKPCGEGSFCDHGKLRSRCKPCGGGSICDHGKRRSRCKPCGGSSICDHDRQRTQCITCTPKHACQHCHHVYVKSRSRFKPYCFNCYCVLNPDADIPRRYKLKEHHVRDTLKDTFPSTKMTFDQKIDNGCSRRRPDVRVECLTHTVIVECDENQHKNYSCENKRVMELFQDLGNRPLIMIHFNPDGYITNGTKREGCFTLTKAGSLSLRKPEWKKRVKPLIKLIRKSIKTVPDKEVTEKYLFYNT